MAKRIQHVGVREAKAHLSRLLRDVERGGEVIVERYGRPVARIVPAAKPVAPCDSYGMFAGQFTIGDDFDEDTDRLADAFGQAPSDVLTR